MKPQLLIIELWGLGDLVIASAFLQAACKQFAVTLLAKPYAQDLRDQLWPEVEVIPFVAPWTAFQAKYHLWNWPWGDMVRIRSQIARRHFEVGLSARWDPRDHFLLRACRVRRRLGFSRLRSSVFLTDPIARPAPWEHRYEYWRALGRALQLELPERHDRVAGAGTKGNTILIHSGAAQPVRVWPLDRYQRLARRLRENHHQVIIACDPDQQAWWTHHGEPAVTVPRSVAELFSLMNAAQVFIGNDSGPGHIAAIHGLPTFTLFGPQLPEWFVPLHPRATFIEGKPCPYKPCSDYCRFPTPHCLWNISEPEVWEAVQRFLLVNLPRAGAPASGSPPVPG
ncbi:MAG TPA: glycosyltransferase family 9 protein [Verrucomicrobiota bacterium]|nr:glycosyltransferase family 9 protein [Verrucomicrobiota bacterium]HNT14322.1 glycosyltransferase family 9 protein [Verrucomicrobiota bacterium]